MSQCSTVVYAGKTYNTVAIGGQCWLQENLDVGTQISGIEGDKRSKNFLKYGSMADSALVKELLNYASQYLMKNEC